MSRTLPKPGQVWESRDKRDDGKRIRIVEAPTGWYGYVKARTVHHPRKDLMGRETSIAVTCINDYYRPLARGEGADDG